MLQWIVIILCAEYFVTASSFSGGEYPREKRSTWDIGTTPFTNKDFPKSSHIEATDLRSKEISSLSPINQVSLNPIKPCNGYQKDCREHLLSNNNDLDVRMVHDWQYLDDRPPPEPPRHNYERGPPPPPPPYNRYDSIPPPQPSHHRHHWGPPPPDDGWYHQPPPRQPPSYSTYHEPPPPIPHDEGVPSFYDDRQTRQSSYYDRPPHHRGPPNRPPPRNYGRPAPYYEGPPHLYSGPEPYHGGSLSHHGRPPPPRGGPPSPDHPGPPPREHPPYENFYNDRGQSNGPQRDMPPLDNSSPDFDRSMPPRTILQVSQLDNTRVSSLSSQSQTQDHRNEDSRPSKLTDLHKNLNSSGNDTRVDTSTEEENGDYGHLLDVRFADDDADQSKEKTTRKSIDDNTSTAVPLISFLYQAPAVRPES